MRSYLFLTTLVCLTATALLFGQRRVEPWQNAGSPGAPLQNDAPSRIGRYANYDNLPLSFESIEGEDESKVKFLARGDGYTVLLSNEATTITLKTPLDRPVPLYAVATHSAVDRHVDPIVQFTLAHANSQSHIEGSDLQPGTSNYLIGNDPSKWRRNVAHFARVKYRAVYPGIDLVYYGNQRNLESDYVIAPHADPNQIVMRIKGASNVRIDSQGNVVASTKAGDALLHRPRVYQQSMGERREIASHYVRRGRMAIGIQVASYDPTRSLIVDPVLSYSTYLGGTADQIPRGIVADSAGYAYVAGYTTSADFPTTAGVLQPTRDNSPTYRAFVTKLKPDGSGVVYSTFLGGGGSAGDYAYAIAVDSSGDAYITGSTSSTDFPVTPATAFQPLNRGYSNGFLTKLDPTGSALLYSTFLGGSAPNTQLARATDTPNAIALDSNGNAYIAGTTTSADFPVVAATALQTANKSDPRVTTVGTAFLSRIDPSKSGPTSLVYSTYLGGSKQDNVLGVAVDGSFNAYVVGYTSSPDFPQPSVRNGCQTILHSVGGNAFLARIDTTKPALLVYSTFLGGSFSGYPAFEFGGASDAGTAVAVSPAGGVAYIAGFTFSSDFPVVAAFDTAKNPNGVSFVARIDTTKSGDASLLSSSYLGGMAFDYSKFETELSVGDSANGIAIDSTGNIYVTGATIASDFPVTPGAPQLSLGSFQNAYQTELNSDASAVVFSTYFGGNNSTVGGNSATSVALDGASPPNAHITGSTVVPVPITPGAFQANDFVVGNNPNGVPNSDGFVAEISPGAVTGVFAAPTALAFSNQTLNVPTSPRNVTLLNNTSTSLTNIAISFTGPNAADFTQGNSTCTSTLAPRSNCLISINFMPTTASSEVAELIVTDSDSGSPQKVALSATRAPVLLQPPALSFGNITATNGASPKTVILTNYTPVAVSGIAISIAGSAAFTLTGPDPYLAGTPTYSNCGTSLNPGASCAFDVVFAPTAVGPANAILTVTDSDAGSPQTMALSGSGVALDFSVNVSPPAVSVMAGDNASATVAINTQTDLRDTINFTCTGAPVGATCSVSPSPANITEDGSGYLASKVTITTTARSFVGPPLNWLRVGSRGSFVGSPIAMLLLLAALLIHRRLANRRLAWAFLSLLLVSVWGCGGGSRGSGDTPAGTYQLTITGTGQAGIRQATLTLTVQ